MPGSIPGIADARSRREENSFCYVLRERAFGIVSSLFICSCIQYLRFVEGCSNLRFLHEGRYRYTTWGYKIAIVEFMVLDGDFLYFSGM